MPPPPCASAEPATALWRLAGDVYDTHFELYGRVPCSAERASAIGGRSAARSPRRWSGTTHMMSAVSTVPILMLSAAIWDDLCSIRSCSCWQSCAWGVIFGSTARRSRRRSPAGRRRRRRPRGMRIRCARSRGARCTSAGARRASGARYLVSASDAPRARTAGPMQTAPGGIDPRERCGLGDVLGVARGALRVSDGRICMNHLLDPSGEAPAPPRGVQLYWSYRRRAAMLWKCARASGEENAQLRDRF